MHNAMATRAAKVQWAGTDDNRVRVTCEELVSLHCEVRVYEAPQQCMHHRGMQVSSERGYLVS